MALNEKDVLFTLKTLMRAAARERVENYALRIALAEAGAVSLAEQDLARKIASKRYEKLLQIAFDSPSEETDLLEFLKAFEGPLQ